MPARHKFLWITDPWDTLDHPQDTTLRLAHEAMTLGHECYWASARTIRFEKGRVLVDSHPMGLPRRATSFKKAGAFDLAPARPSRPQTYSQIHYRTDPPVDLTYLQPLQILCRSEQARIVNPPAVLFRVNEKLEASALGKLMPPSIAASERDSLMRFLRAERRAVLKPMHLAQSKGIELLDLTQQGEKTIFALLARATDNYTRPVVLQRFLAEIAEGETRLWFLDGALLAAVDKLPVRNDFRVDMDRGSRLAPTRLVSRDRRTAAAIGKHLRLLGVRLAAIDLIDGKITDFNITSPGLISQMEKLLGENLALPIIRALVKGPVSR